VTNKGYMPAVGIVCECRNVHDEVNEEDLLSIVSILSPKNTVNHLLKNFKIYPRGE
jgi:hypothetical protein